MGKKEKNPFLELLRKRRRMSKRMVEMLEYIREKGRVHWNHFNSYSDGRTIDALIRRNLIHRGMSLLDDGEDASDYLYPSDAFIIPMTRMPLGL